VKEEKEGNKRTRREILKRVQGIDGWLGKRCIGMKEEEKQGIVGDRTME
jgi:hypothetical protein